MSYAYKTGTAQSQQITALSKLSTHTVNPETYMPQCPLCLSHTHNTNHLFNCSQITTQHHTSIIKPFKTAVLKLGSIEAGGFDELVSGVQQRSG